MTGRDTAIERAKLVREVMLDHGVPEVSIEVLPGRPTSGDVWNALDPVAVMSHHIVSNPTETNPTPGLALVKKGTGVLPGPLCNGTAGVDLVYRIICLGLANHPGYGGPMVVSGPLGSYRIPQDNARPYVWGTEYEGGIEIADWDRTYTNRRTGKAMTFREFMGRCNAALCEAIWLPGVSSRGKTADSSMDLASYHMEHNTWAPTRKIDRLRYTQASGQAEIRKFNEVEDEMQYTDWSEESKQALVDDLLRQKVTVRKNFRTNDTKQITIRQAIARAANATVVIKETEADLKSFFDASDTANEDKGATNE